MTKTITRIAPDVGWLPISFANVYFIGRPGRKWMLVDAGLPGRAAEIIEAAEAHFGGGSRPTAILLTHGHMDHIGSALSLAEIWDVPIYAHHLEMPYLTGKSFYPPADPTVGGAIAFLSRFFPARARDLGPRLQALPKGKVPGTRSWRWIATPGHSPGHVSFFRASDRALLAGDAFATVNMDSWRDLVTGRQRLSRPPSPSTIDWELAQSSINALAGLRPNVVGCGHFIPISDGDLPERLHRFADDFQPPRYGRYVRRAARTNEDGIVDLPRAPFDPLPFATVAALVAFGIAIGTGCLEDRQQK
jgi:glyoxylase-like metal-dependent hydrolase (beta-lactamase superfamily II)